MRTVGLIFLVGGLAVAMSGCTASERKYKKAVVGEKSGLPNAGPPGGADAAGSGGSRAAVRDEVGLDSTSPGKVTTDRVEGTADGHLAPAMKPAVAEAMAGTASRHPRRQKDPPPSTLTAGSFDDGVDSAQFNHFLSLLGQNPDVGDLPERMRGTPLVVLVKDGAGQPVGKARVEVSGAAGGPSVELITRADGRVVVQPTWDRLTADGGFKVTVTPPDNSAAVTQKVPKGSRRWEVALPKVRAELPKKLDLAIVLDTTGSMTDEIVYLKSEVKNIARQVHERFPQVDQHFALVCYRDDGDEYVVRRFDFTPSLDEFHRNLSAQSAAGGGDPPEAMHRGLQEALQLRWREGNTARVLFLIADAPPHAQFMGDTLAVANSLRRNSVALYPVACSGYDDACEFVMRTSALLSGAQFLFLTNDSGVGESHAEPHIPFYRVEKLNGLMVRMIANELTGRRIAPTPAEVIRTVGKPVN
jgi:hypothetical protein